MSLDAFARPEPENSPRAFSTRRLSGLLAALRADLSADADGFRLQLEPVTPRGVLDFWFALAPTTHSSTVLVDRQAGPLAAATVAEPGLLERMLPVGGDRWMLVQVDGAVEAGDLRAMHLAATGGASVFDVEFRASVTAGMIGARAAAFTAREQSPLLKILAMALRGYVASLLRSDSQLIALPSARLVEALMAPSGRMCIRPIESVLSSTAIDIGIDTLGSDGAAPANDALIYDIYGNSWHGD